LDSAAAKDSGVVVKTASSGKDKKTRSVRKYVGTKPKYCGCC